MASSHKHDAEVSKLATCLRRRQITGSFNVAKHTAEVLRLVVSSNSWSTTEMLLQQVQDIGKKLMSAAPAELAVGNVARRILHMIREEHDVAEETKTETKVLPGLHQKLQEGKRADYTASYNIRGVIIEAINEFIDDIKHIYSSIAAQAVEHIHAREIILTFGRSTTVRKFFEEAAKGKREFDVLVAEGAPSYDGHNMATELAKSGINATVISDSAVFSMMARVNKVIMGTHAVLANGGLLATCGTHMVALAAKQHSVPLVVCTGLYKFGPKYSYDQDTFNELKSPNSILPFDEANQYDNLTIHNPAYDYVPPELVSLFVTNAGGHPPTYVYRLLKEYYHLDDYNL